MTSNLEGRHIETGQPVVVEFSDGLITSIEELRGDLTQRELPWIAPGLFDLQINGHGGTWFSHAGLSTADIARALEPHFAFGVTRMLPTLITNSEAALLSGFRALQTGL